MVAILKQKCVAAGTLALPCHHRQWSQPKQYPTLLRYLRAFSLPRRQELLKPAQLTDGVNWLTKHKCTKLAELVKRVANTSPKKIRAKQYTSCLHTHPKMLIYASDVAAAAGRNKYKPAWKVFEAMWRRLQPEQYAECVSLYASRESQRACWLSEQLQRAVQPQAERVQAVTTTAEVQQLVEAAQSQATTLLTEEVSKVWKDGAQEVLEQVQACQTEAAVRQLMTTEQPAEVVSKLEETAQLLKTKEELVDKARQEVHCTFGTVREEASRQQVEQQLGEVVHTNQFHVLWMQHALNTSGTRWGVGGRVDGVDGQGRVVEIKNRTRQFFYKVVDYEWVQMQAYMALLDAPSAVLVQQLNEQQKITLVERDVVEWRAILVPALYKFANLLDLFMSGDSHVMREEWARSSDRDKASIFNAWLTQACGSQSEEEEENAGRGHFVF